jgi:hypothetical protein
MTSPALGTCRWTRSQLLTCGLVMLFGSTTRKRIAWSRVALVDGRVVVELRPVGLDVPDTVRVTLPGDRLVSRLGTAAD